MKTVCEKNCCVGCMACVDMCPKKAISIQDSLKSYNAVINTEKCINCNACHNVCQNNVNDTEFLYPIEWHQGWANDPIIRNIASSGGYATAIAKAFLQSEGVVCSCYFKEGQFLFKSVNKIEQLNDFIGSKYVKSNPQGIYKEVDEILSAGQKVLFIGLPCQVAALKKYIRKKRQKLLYTIDLICHGTPSPKLLDLYLHQKGLSLSGILDIGFRVKTKFQLMNQKKGVEGNGVCDRYSIAFLNAMTYTDNCYSCRYARIERISDMTLGDSWGSELPIEETKKGISLVLVQNDKGKELLDLADITCIDVSLENAISHNHQLQLPSKMPIKRDVFFEKLKQGKNFDGLVTETFTKMCLKQDIKKILIALRIYRD